MPVKIKSSPTIQTLSQSEFIQETAQIQSIPKAKIAEALKILRVGLKDVLKQQKSVRLFEIGHFKVHYQIDREGRNPRTGEKLKIPGHFALKVMPSITLKNSVKASTRDGGKNAKKK